MKSKIDRKNRDRKGGHSSTILLGKLSPMFPGEILNVVVRAFVKREGKRKARRQNNAAVEQALIVWETEIAQDWRQAMLDDLDYDDSYSSYDYFADENPEYEIDQYEDHYSDDDYGANDYWESDWDYNYLHDGGRDTHTQEAKIIEDLAKPLDFVRISSQHLGETLGTLLRIYM